jgi:hypothetical protein
MLWLCFWTCCCCVLALQDAAVAAVKHGGTNLRRRRSAIEENDMILFRNLQQQQQQLLSVSNSNSNLIPNQAMERRRAKKTGHGASSSASKKKAAATPTAGAESSSSSSFPLRDDLPPTLSHTAPIITAETTTLKRVVIKYNPQILSRQECLLKLRAAQFSTMNIIHADLYKTNSIAIEISLQDEILLHALLELGDGDDDDGKAAGISYYNDPIRTVLHIPESLRIVKDITKQPQGGRRFLQDEDDASNGVGTDGNGNSHNNRKNLILPSGVEMVLGHAGNVWNRTKGEHVTVCIIDSGCFPHVDFDSANVNGSFSPDVLQPWALDNVGHGTHVAGTVAAAAAAGANTNASENNDGRTEGIMGVAPLAKLLIVRVFDSQGQFRGSDVLAAATACQEGGANIISMSLGGPDYDKDEDALFASLLLEDGILVVAAAGNSGQTAIQYPSGYDSVVTVGAVNERGNPAWFSTRNDKVDVAAPGMCWNVPYTRIFVLWLEYGL